MGRTAETWVDIDAPVGAYVEVIDLTPTDEGIRPKIPPQGRACVSWLKEWGGGRALLELDEPGRIRLHSWKPYGERIVAKRKELAASSDEEDVAELITLAERFRKVAIERSGRFPLHQREQIHLALGPSSGWSAILVCSRQNVELWNEDFRRRWRQQHPLDLSWMRETPA